MNTHVESRVHKVGVRRTEEAEENWQHLFRSRHEGQRTRQRRQGFADGYANAGRSVHLGCLASTMKHGYRRRHSIHMEVNRNILYTYRNRAIYIYSRSSLTQRKRRTASAPSAV